MEEWNNKGKETNNLKEKAICALEYYGKTFADVNWWGLMYEESWPLDKMEEWLDIEINPKMDRISEMLVLVGDNWYIEYLPDYNCFGVNYIPKEPETKKDSPWFWDGERDE